jgi:hypothetical protein
VQCSAGHWGRCSGPSGLHWAGAPERGVAPQALYGYLEVDFPRGKVRMGVRTPEEREEIFHEISF